MMKRAALFLVLGLFIFGSLAVAQTAIPATPDATVGGDFGHRRKPDVQGPRSANR